MPRLGIYLKLQRVVTQTARLARDLWNVINDIWENETRKWEDIT